MTKHPHGFRTRTAALVAAGALAAAGLSAGAAQAAATNPTTPAKTPHCSLNFKSYNPGDEVEIETNDSTYGHQKFKVICASDGTWRKEAATRLTAPARVAMTVSAMLAEVPVVAPDLHPIAQPPAAPVQPPLH
jgi:hypothetical protein